MRYARVGIEDDWKTGSEGNRKKEKEVWGGKNIQENLHHLLKNKS